MNINNGYGTAVGWGGCLCEGQSQKSEVGGRRTEQGKEFAGQKSWPRFHSTFDIIEAANAGKLPEQMMMTFHPQRWTDNLVEWTKELVWQNVKNIIKKGMVSRKDAEAQRTDER